MRVMGPLVMISPGRGESKQAGDIAAGLHLYPLMGTTTLHLKASMGHQRSERDLPLSPQMMIWRHSWQDTSISR